MDEFILEVEACLFAYRCIRYGCSVAVDYAYGVLLYQFRVRRIFPFKMNRRRINDRVYNICL